MNAINLQSSPNNKTNLANLQGTIDNDDAFTTEKDSKGSKYNEAKRVSDVAIVNINPRKFYCVKITIHRHTYKWILRPTKTHVCIGLKRAQGLELGYIHNLHVVVEMCVVKRVNNIIYPDIMRVHSSEFPIKSSP